MRFGRGRTEPGGGVGSPWRLGEGRLEAEGVGGKAANLDRAAAAGIAVPPGFVIPHGRPDRLTVADLEPLGSGPCAVRSAFSVEDRPDSSLAGYFRTELHVEATVGSIRSAVESVRASADTDLFGDAIRLDVLVMRQITPRHAGVAFTEAQFEDDLVNATTGLADRLVSGLDAGQTLTLAKRRRFDRSDRSVPGWQQRLATLLRSVRSTFGERDWDIEWADDGDTCWLIQIRPITAPPRRNETFTIANHKEILPELPSVLMASVVQSSAFDLMDHYRAAGPHLPVDRPFIETFAGRPYINLSQLTDLLRRLGLPTTLLSSSLGGEPEIVVGLRPLRIVTSLPVFVRLGLAQLTVVGHARRTEERIDELVRRPTDDFASILAGLRSTYILLVTEMSALATAMAGPVSVVRSLGALDAHLARQRTPGTAMLDDLESLMALAERDPALRSELRAGRLPDDPGFIDRWQVWLDRHGHRGVFESDIARPRFAEQPAPILAAIAQGRRAVVTPPDRSGVGLEVRRRLTSPLWFVARRPMAARERIRWHTMQAFAAYRARLLERAEHAVADGLLPDVEAVFDLTIEELTALDRGEPFPPGDLTERRAERERLGALRLPDLVRRFDDVEELGSAERPDLQGPPGLVATGVPLTRGRVAGVALRCSEPPSALPEGFDAATTVLVARSVDAGWVPIFGSVAAVAVEIGGDLSHGSIILRELGVPAVTNLGPLPGLATGDRVELDATVGRLRRFEPVGQAPGPLDPPVG